MYRSLAVIAVFLALVVPFSAAIGMQVPSDMPPEYDLEIGDEIGQEIVVVGDQNTNEIQFFVDIKDDIARIDGNTQYFENATIDPNERRTFDFEIEAHEAGQVRVEYGFRYTREGSGNIGFTNVNANWFTINIEESDEQREERLLDEFDSESSSSGGINTTAGSQDDTASNDRSEPDPQLQDTSPQGGALTQIDTDDSQQNTQNRNTGVNIDRSGSDEQIGFLITIFAASLIAVIGGIGAFRYGRKNDML